MSLEALLRARIRERGPLTFRAFMAEALYHPEHGYYAAGRAWEGSGDFVTGPRMGPGLAMAVARVAAWVKDALGPGPFEVVEVGSGRGDLAAQLHPLLRDAGLRLRVVEHRRPPRLPPGVPWSASARGLAVRGLVVSNELFDALPVHVVRTRGGALEEAFVALEGERLALRWGPPSRPEVGAYLDRFGLRPEEGAMAEAGLDALAMLGELGGALEAGALLTLDYGDTAPGLRARPEGTLVALRAHRGAPDALAAPGHQDLTAHVNFTALEQEGATLGLEVVRRVSQLQLLASTGVVAWMAQALQGPGWREALAAKALVAPGGMGDFQALLQAKGLGPAARARLGAALDRRTETTEGF